jgi:glycosyltransferase involved in cell wall biosynthesis
MRAIIKAARPHGGLLHKMKICHINLAKDYRGGERQTELLIRELASRDQAQRLVVRHGHDLVRRCSDVPDLEIIEVASNPVAAAIATRGCSLVHAHEARGVYSAWLASLLFRIPYVITRRVLNPQKPSFLRNRAFNGASAVVSISSAVAEPMRPVYPEINFKVVPDAHAALESDPQAVAAIRDKYPGKFLIGNVSALDPMKGQMTMVEAARQVRDVHPDWQFVVCGSGAEEQRLRDAIGDLDNIDLVGFIEQPGSYYACFDVFAFPTLREAIGSAMIDAMYFGLPVVASNVGGIPEFAVDGVNGRLIEPERPDLMVAAIEELIEKPEWAASVRAANIERASTLDAVAMTDRYEAIYTEIL